ncbi:MAG TPA: hypothetical protein VFF73_36445 [Planctomycetota bacterium]|nr:hypothetical protein [Planctomycetota bacterium]
MGRQDEKTSAVHKVVRHGASWFQDWLAGQAIATALVIFFFSLGIGYAQDDEVIEKATVVSLKQAGSKSLAEGYHEFWKATDDFKKSLLTPFPEEWHEPLKAWSLRAAGLILVGAVLFLLFRAPSRAHAVREIGWGIAAPGLLTALATIILEWRAMKGIRATVLGERTVRSLWEEGRDAAQDCFSVLWPALAVAAGLVALGVFLERRHNKYEHERRLSVEHVISHFLLIAGSAVIVHFVTAIVLGAVTENASTGASMAPFARSPAIYSSCIGLFALGATLWFLARAEVKKIEAREK